MGEYQNYDYDQNLLKNLDTVDEPNIAANTTKLSQRVQWEKFSFTGAQLKALDATASSDTSATVTLSAGLFPTDSILTGVILRVDTADTGSASTATISLGSNSGATDLLGATTLQSTGNTGVSTSFVPVLASSADFKATLAVTGSGKHISDIASTTVIDIFLGFTAHS